MLIKSDEMVRLFLAESQGYIKRIFKLTKELKAEVNKTTLENYIYQLESFRTTSALMGYTVLFSLIKGLEKLLSAVKLSRVEFNSKILQLIFYTCDMFVLIIKNIDEVKSDDLSIELFLDAFQKAESGQSFSFDKMIDILQPEFLLNANKMLQRDEQKSIANIQTVEVGIDRIDGIIKQFETLVLKQFQLKKYIDDINKEIEKNNSTFLKNLKKQLKDDLESLDLTISEVQKNIFQLRLISLSIILKLVQEKINAELELQNKIVDFYFPEVNIYLDKDLLESLSEILYQLLKNTIDHAYEDPGRRIKQGKDKNLQVHIDIYPHAEHVTFEISDDGKGIDFEMVRFRALDLFPEKTESIMEMNERELSGFLYEPTFSSIEDGHSLSSRGYGLDIVRRNIYNCKGKISLNTEKNIGTEFSFSIPTTMENLKGVFVKAGTFTFLIPVHFIAEIYNCELSDLLVLQNSTMFRLRDEVLPVYSLNALINEKSEIKNIKKNVDTQVILVIGYLEKRIGISINELLHTVSVIVKPLPLALKKLTAFQGLVLDETHHFVPVLNIPELIDRLEFLQSYSLIKVEAQIVNQTKKVLVVDSSEITREIHKSILEAEDFFVDTVSDGIEALHEIKKRNYDIIITDLKFSRMSGIVFIENLKRIDGYEETPVLIISSLDDKSIVEKAKLLGVQDFIYKSLFNRENMVKIVKELAYGTK